MTVGLILLAISLMLLAYAYYSYKKVTHILAAEKQQDLVSYYLDLAYNLLPLPFWSALLGIALILVAFLLVLISLPFQF